VRIGGWSTLVPLSVATTNLSRFLGELSLSSTSHPEVLAFFSGEGSGVYYHDYMFIRHRQIEPQVVEPGDAGDQALLRLHHDERATFARPIYRNDRQSDPESL
jgi:hypothetical protein